MKNFFVVIFFMISTLFFSFDITEGASTKIFDEDIKFLKEEILEIAKNRKHTALINLIEIVFG